MMLDTHKIAAAKSIGNKMIATAFSGCQQFGKTIISPSQNSRNPVMVEMACCIRNLVRKTHRKSCSVNIKIRSSDGLSFNHYNYYIIITISWQLQALVINYIKTKKEQRHTQQMRTESIFKLLYKNQYFNL